MTDRADDDEEGRGYASPACFMHEVDPDYIGFSVQSERRSWAYIAQWRKGERERLIKARLAISVKEREEHSDRIAAGLDRLIGDPSRRVISFYWPFRGEPDLRAWMTSIHDRGGCCGLPVVIARDQPLVFRQWIPGARLDRGVWNIPIPADGGEVVPDIVIAPVVGFDLGCYRLGYGGGFFDRTLAAMPAKPRIIGVGYAQAAIATIFPRPHDIPMNCVVTEQDVIEPLRNV